MTRLHSQYMASACQDGWHEFPTLFTAIDGPIASCPNEERTVLVCGSRTGFRREGRVRQGVSLTGVICFYRGRSPRNLPMPDSRQKQLAALLLLGSLDDDANAQAWYLARTCFEFDLDGIRTDELRTG
jgi:hypothetical protein